MFAVSLFLCLLLKHANGKENLVACGENLRVRPGDNLVIRSHQKFDERREYEPGEKCRVHFKVGGF